ncbi:hypothetical protein WICPIJ_005222 [Wickerhamomyces pijperi]|uniref:Secreted protein n=1 Tax=Wickerhamomyces pijperi TaxID=599730 RepID=A0A9P8TM11_WICPI|nr:hypothetical protein WICPIJ_005222 [Wickerhamomyces pijperi]
MLVLILVWPSSSLTLGLPELGIFGSEEIGGDGKSCEFSRLDSLTIRMLFDCTTRLLDFLARVLLLGVNVKFPSTLTGFNSFLDSFISITSSGNSMDL